MTAVIEKKIVGYKVVTKEETPTPTEAVINVLHENVERPEVLLGSTYKIKTPDSDHAIYVTINDIVMNAGTAHEERRPYEIFVNSKNMDHFQWVIALTRVVSAVFRKGGEVAFLAEELKSVFAPKGGYFKKGKFMPSLVAELGFVLETHLQTIGMIKVEHDENMAAFIEKKREEHGVTKGEFPDYAVECSKCNTKAAVMMDGCLTCLSCGDSKCGV